MEFIQALFFDGQTAKPITAQLNWNQERQELLIATADTSMPQVWPLADLQVAHYNKHGLTLKNKLNSTLTLSISGQPEASNYLYEQFKSKGVYNFNTETASTGIGALVFISLFLVFAIGAGWYWGVPYAAEKAVVLLPQSFDDQLGEASESGLFLGQDTLPAAELNTFFKNIQPNAVDLKRFKLSLIKSDVVNAFALPNGRIVVHTGLLKKMNSPEQLAALLAHEATHVRNRHGIKSLSRSLSSYLILSALVGDVTGISAVLIENANNLNSLSYSRRFEKESDIEGCEWLIKSQVNPKGMVELMQILKDSESMEVPAYLSSHPATDDRLTYTKEFIRDKQANYATKPALAQSFAHLKALTH